MDNSLLDVRDINHKIYCSRKKVIPASAAHCHRKWGKDMQSRPNGKREDCIEMETKTYNADAVGAYNILRKYHSVSGVKRELSVTGLKTPEIIKVAV